MKAKRDYYKELSEIRDAICAEILNELKRIGKDFETLEEQENGHIDFFSYPVVNDKGIEQIKADGRVVLNGVTTTLQKVLANDTISIADIIGLLEDLRDFE